jgi:hypothetical protein
MDPQPGEEARAVQKAGGMISFVRTVGAALLALALYDLIWWGLIGSSLVGMSGGFVHAFFLPFVLPAAILLVVITLVSRNLGERAFAWVPVAPLIFVNGLLTGCTMFLAPLERCT